MIRVSRLSIAPVRSLGLSHPDSVELTETGVLEDRRFYLIDEHARLIDQLIAAELVQVVADTDPDATELRLTFPDGGVLEGPVELAEAVETDVHSRTAWGHVVIGPWGGALEPFAKRSVRVVRCDLPAGTRRKDGQVRNAVSLVSDGSLGRLARELDVAVLDPLRFRMLIEVAGAAEHEEDDWIGGEVEIGTAILSITKPDARCAITTHNPATGERDLDTLRTLIRYRGLYEGRKAIFGVLGEVGVPGRISVGDEVRVLQTIDAAHRQPVAADGV